MIEEPLYQLTKFLERYWKKKILKKNEPLYKNKEKDKNLYLIKKWEIDWIVNWKSIFTVFWPEIYWEKSFLENKWKPIDAIVKSDEAIIYILSPEKFENLSNELKINLLKNLTIYVSERVYKLNNILKNIKLLTDLLFKDEVNLDNFFKIFWKIDEYYIFKNQKELPIIKSNLYPTEQIIKFIEDNFDQDLKIGQNYILNKTKNYIFFLTWNIEKKNFYIISNTLLYSKWIFEHLWEKLERQKINEIEKNLN